MTQHLPGYHPYRSRFVRARQFLAAFDQNLVHRPDGAENALNEFVKKQLKNCGREQVLRHLCECLMVCYTPGLFKQGCEKVIRVIDQVLRGTNESEKLWAMLLAKLIMLHVGDCLLVCTILNPTLIAMIKDEVETNFIRGKCCTTLALINFLGADDLNDVYKLMKLLESLFSVNYQRDGVTPTDIPSYESSLHTSALTAWSLLFTLLPGSDLKGWDGCQEHKVLSSMKNLMSLLQSRSSLVRTAAAEMFALLMESGREEDPNFLFPFKMTLCRTIRKLTNGEDADVHDPNNKTLLDIVRFISRRTNFELNIKVKFGTEAIEIKTWAAYHYYSMVWNVIGPGMSSHVRYNTLIREMFEMDPNVKADNVDNDEPLRLLKFLHYLSLTNSPTAADNNVD